MKAKRVEVEKLKEQKVKCIQANDVLEQELIVKSKTVKVKDNACRKFKDKKIESEENKLGDGLTQLEVIKPKHLPQKPKPVFYCLFCEV